MNDNYALSVIDYGPPARHGIDQNHMRPLHHVIRYAIYCLLIYKRSYLSEYIFLEKIETQYESSCMVEIKLILLIYCESSNDILAPYNLIKFISYCKLNNTQCKLIFYLCKSRNKWCLDDWVIIKGKILHDWMHANPTNCLLMYSGIQLSISIFAALCIVLNTFFFVFRKLEGIYHNWSIIMFGIPINIIRNTFWQLW